MATVNFSVPDAVKEAFNDAFSDINQSGIISDLMMRAAEEEQRKKEGARQLIVYWHDAEANGP